MDNRVYTNREHLHGTSGISGGAGYCFHAANWAARPVIPGRDSPGAAVG
jgi:hypothetical protein